MKMLFKTFPQNISLVLLPWLGYTILSYTAWMFILTNGSLGVIVSIGIILATLRKIFLTSKHLYDYQNKINTLSLQNNLVSALYSKNNQLQLYFQKNNRVWEMNGLPASINPLHASKSLFVFEKHGEWFSISSEEATFVTNKSIAKKLEFLTKEDLKETLELLTTVWEASLMKKRLENAFLGVASMFIQLTDKKDSDTHHHSLRVSQISMKLASKLELPVYLLFELKIGSLLHDIGKLVIQSELIKKKGLLTTSERALVETHPAAGLKLIAPLRNYKNVSSIVIQHHEHINGTGYPNGISGKEISLCARIVAVADAFDAIISSRSYHLGKSKEVAFKIINDSSGTHFDAKVVDALSEILDEL